MEKHEHNGGARRKSVTLPGSQDSDRTPHNSSPSTWQVEGSAALGESSSGKAWAVALIASAFGLLFTALIVVTLLANQRERQTIEVDSLAERTSVAVERRLDAYKDVLFGLQGFFGAEPDASRSDFNRFVDLGDFEERYPGIQALEFTRLVADDEVAAFEDAVRSDVSLNGVGYPEFTVHPADPDHSDHFVVDFVEPLVGNEQAFGFDLGSSVERRLAVEAARDTRQAVATGGISLVQEQKEQPGFLLLQAIYASGHPPSTVEGRRAEFVGLVSAVFRVADMFEGTFDDAVADVEIYDAGVTTASADDLRPDRNDLLLDLDASRSILTGGEWGDDSRVAEVGVGGRTWLISMEFQASAVSGGSDQHLLIVTISAGLLLSIAGGLFAFSRSRSSSRNLLKASEERFRTLINAAPEGILIVNERRTILLANHQVQQMFGYSQADLIGRSVDMLLPERHRETHSDHIEGYAAEPQRRVMGAGRLLSGRRSDGTEFPVAIGLAPLPSPDETLVAATVTDMTEHQFVEDQLLQANSELEQRVGDLQEIRHQAAMLSSLGEMLQLSESSEEACRVLATHSPVLFGGTTGAIALLGDAQELMTSEVTWGDTPLTESTFDPDRCWALRRGKPHLSDTASGNVACEHLEDVGSRRVLCVPIIAHGAALGIIVLVDVGDDREKSRELGALFADQIGPALANINLREALRVESIRDPLTSLFNRRYMEESLDREIDRAHRLGTSIGMLMIDLDHFKQLNDSRGHLAGDAVLRSVGEILRSATRGEDVPCRYGGEEFVVIMPGADIELAASRAEQIRLALSNSSWTIDGEELKAVTLSAGVSVYPGDGSTAAELIGSADRALFEAKAAGRDRVVLASESDSAATVRASIV